MGWNDSGNGKDPWKRNDEEPNDLDQIVQNWQRRLSSILGGGGGRSANPTGGGGFRVGRFLEGADCRFAVKRWAEDSGGTEIAFLDRTLQP